MRSGEASSTPEVGFEVSARHVRVVLRGELDLDAVALLADELAAAEGLGRPLIVVDLDAVTLLTAAAMHALLRAESRITARRGRLVLVCRQPAIRRILHVARIDRRMTVYGSAGDAMAPPRVQRAPSGTTLDPRPLPHHRLAG
jgi:anti-sigma B factor antagonist